MARPSKHNWEDIRKHYEAGMSQAQIVLEFECPKSSLSEKVKKESWKQSELVKDYIIEGVAVNEQKANLTEQKANLTEFKANLIKKDKRIVEIADKIIEEKARREGLIFNATELLVKRAAEMAKRNKTVEKIGIGDGMQKFASRELTSSDLKNLTDTVDKASITLRVNERHSNSQINVQNNNSIKQEVKEIDDFYEA